MPSPRILHIITANFVFQICLSAPISCFTIIIIFVSSFSHKQIHYSVQKKFSFTAPPLLFFSCPPESVPAFFISSVISCSLLAVGGCLLWVVPSISISAFCPPMFRIFSESWQRYFYILPPALSRIPSEIILEKLRSRSENLPEMSLKVFRYPAGGGLHSDRKQEPDSCQS